jgi:TPR repeat protein
VFWFQKAAAQNSADAEFNLGFMYEHGQGVQLDFSKAAEYYDLGAQHGPSQQMHRKLMISLDVRSGAEHSVSKVCRAKTSVTRRCR